MNFPFRLLLPLLVFLAAPLLRAQASKPVISEGSKSLPLAGESFQFDGHEAFVILPEKTSGPIPWVWYAPTLRGLPSKAEIWMFQRFLAAGIAIAGIDAGESYGSPDGRTIYSRFHDHLTGTRRFSPKPCLLARSRGGLMLYNWAVEHPDQVAGIAGIYPVCNLESYPGLAKAAGAYKLTSDDLKKQLANHNPVSRLAPLAKAGVPLFHLHGDNDKVVPLEGNTALLAERYRKLGGPITVEIIKGGGHDMRQAWFQSETLTQFLIKHALAR